MQTEPARPQGLLARLKARLRGDRYMVDAYTPDAATPVAAPTPVAPPAPTTP